MKTLAYLKGGKVRLAAFGDSNTEFNHWSFGRNYVSMLACNLYNLFPSSVVINCGHSGDNTADALKRIDDVLDCNANAVIVAFGLNDAFQQRGIRQFREDYSTLLQKLMKKIPVVITRTSNPMINMADGSEYLGPCPDIAEYMNVITGLSEEFDLCCIDHYSLWKESIRHSHHGELVMLMGNAMHPNEQGHRRFYAEMAPQLGLELFFQNEYLHILNLQNS